jgi:predicted Zn-dependent protease
MPSTSTPFEAGAPVHLPFEGRYSDGRTAVSRRVRIAIGADSLVIGGDDGGPAVTWPLAALATGEPIVTRSVDVLVHAPGRSGPTLFVADPAFVRALGTAAPHLTGAAVRWRAARPLLAVTTSVGLLAAAVAVFDLAPARGIASLVPYETRARLGRSVVGSLSAEACTRPEGVVALRTLQDRLTRAAGPNRRFEVSVVDHPMVNAFAAPGEVIVLMRGAIDQAKGPDEIAGILAHEMGHGIELHPEAGVVRGVGLALLGELVLGGSSGGTIASAALVVTTASYSREAEREADTHGLRILREAGISTSGIAQFFERMLKSEERTSAQNRRMLDVLRSHPQSAERLAVARASTGYPTTPALTPAEWAALRDICRKPE